MSSPSVYELSAPNGSMSVVSASKGSFILNNTSTYTTYNVRAIVVLQDTVFNEIRHAGLAGNVVSTYIGTPATAVKAGAIITPIESKLFSNIKLTSGSVALVL
jgi:hypothetical protein